MEKSETIGKLMMALAKAQGEIGNAAKDSTNPHFRSKYADLASVRDAVKDALSKHGIAYVQLPEEGPDTVTLTTMLALGDEWIRASYQIKPVKADPQGIGSAVTYARRYALMAAVGIAPEDDDGNAASGKAESARKGNPAKQAADRIADDIEACGDREELDAYWNSADVQDWLAVNKDSLHASATEERYLRMKEKLPERAVDQRNFNGGSEAFAAELTKKLNAAETMDELGEAWNSAKPHWKALDAETKKHLTALKDSRKKAVSVVESPV